MIIKHNHDCWGRVEQGPSCPPYYYGPAKETLEPKENISKIDLDKVLCAATLLLYESMSYMMSFCCDLFLRAK